MAPVSGNLGGLWCADGVYIKWGNQDRDKVCVVNLCSRSASDKVFIVVFVLEITFDRLIAVSIGVAS